jgi:protein kinase A
LVLDDQGYVRLTDLGVSREIKANNAEDTSGTPGYMAPEVICKLNHSYDVDYFALGVIAYEFMVGKVLLLLF